MKNRALGTLLGVAVGDALGTTLEFTRPPCDDFPTKLTGPLTDIVGGGPFVVAPGQVTDDTQMAVALATSLMEKNGFDPEDIAARYKEWRTSAFDIGGQTSSAISAQSWMPDGEKRYAGYKSWSSGRNSAGNGSLMRTAPIGVFFAYDAKKRTEASVVDSAITHADPRCMLACAAYNWATARAIRGAKSVYQLFSSAEQGIEAGADFIRKHDVMKTWFSEDELNNARRDLYSDLAAADREVPEGMMQMLHGSAGFVRTAFRYAFWSLRNAKNYEEAIIDVVNRGGDADTNGAIVGGLLGAWFGTESIPETWVGKVTNALSEADENKTGKQAHGSVWWTTYHPRLFLDLKPQVAN